MKFTTATVTQHSRNKQWILLMYYSCKTLLSRSRTVKYKINTGGAGFSNRPILYLSARLEAMI